MKCGRFRGLEWILRLQWAQMFLRIYETKQDVIFSEDGRPCTWFGLTSELFNVQIFINSCWIFLVSGQLNNWVFPHTSFWLPDTVWTINNRMTPKFRLSGASFECRKIDHVWFVKLIYSTTCCDRKPYIARIWPDFRTFNSRREWCACSTLTSIWVCGTNKVKAPLVNHNV